MVFRGANLVYFLGSCPLEMHSDSSLSFILACSIASLYISKAVRLYSRPSVAHRFANVAKNEISDYIKSSLQTISTDESLVSFDAILYR